MPQKYLIWSNSHKEWWKADGMGYTKKREEAGRYTIEEAHCQALNGHKGQNTPKYADVLVLDKD